MMARLNMANKMVLLSQMTTLEATKELDAPLQKMVNYTNTLKAKNDKLSEENAKLKSELVKAKTSNSRIRRIPAKSSPKAQTGEGEAEA